MVWRVARRSGQHAKAGPLRVSRWRSKAGRPAEVTRPPCLGVVARSPSRKAQLPRRPATVYDPCITRIDGNARRCTAYSTMVSATFGLSACCGYGGWGINRNRMLTRRQLVWAGGAAALMTPFSGFARAAERAAGRPIFRFGVVADPQYAPIAPSGTRYFTFRTHSGNSARQSRSSTGRISNSLLRSATLSTGIGAAMVTCSRSTKPSSTRTSLSSETMISTWQVIT